VSAKDYEVIAAALREARRAAVASGSVDTVVGVDRAIAEVGRALRARHKGSYAWKQSRWDQATEFGQA
jgi:hypothetical protein